MTTSVDDIRDVRASVSSSITEEHARFCGFGGWFDVHFRVSFDIFDLKNSCCAMYDTLLNFPCSIDYLGQR